MYPEKLAKIRKNLDLSQEQISSQIGISYRAYTSYERGDRNPSLDFIQKLAKIFSVNLNWFFVDKGEMFLKSGEDEFKDVKEDILKEVEEMFKKRGL